jgi:glycine cleavage system H protein
MSYPPGVPGPPGFPPGHIPGLHYPGTLIPNPAAVALAEAQAAMQRQAAAAAALAALRQRMAGHWFTPEHGWLAISGQIATIGLTVYAANGLGGIVHVSLPMVGVTVTAGDPCGQVESTKAISDLYAPVDGEVSEVNGELATKPRLINSEPYGTGWIYRIRMAAADGGAALPPGLLSPAVYEELTKGVG